MGLLFSETLFHPNTPASICNQHTATSCRTTSRFSELFPGEMPSLSHGKVLLQQSGLTSHLSFPSSAALFCFSPYLSLPGYRIFSCLYIPHVMLLCNIPLHLPFNMWNTSLTLKVGVFLQLNCLNSVFSMLAHFSTSVLKHCHNWISVSIPG